MKGLYVSRSEFFHGNSKLTLYEDDVYIYKCASRFLLVLWCLTALSKMLHLYRGSQGFCWRKPEEPEKPTDLSHVTDEHFHNIGYLAMYGIRFRKANMDIFSSIVDLNIHKL